MARDRKRTKQVEELVNRANNIFKFERVKDPYNDSLFMFLSDFLLDKRMYRGYNFYKIHSLVVVIERLADSHQHNVRNF